MVSSALLPCVCGMLPCVCGIFNFVAMCEYKWKPCFRKHVVDSIERRVIVGVVVKCF